MAITRDKLKLSLDLWDAATCGCVQKERSAAPTTGAPSERTGHSVIHWESKKEK